MYELLADSATVIRLIESDNLVPLVAIIFGSIIAVTAIGFTMWRSVAVAKAREATKRELAAYVAEGSISSEQAVAIINAGRAAWEVNSPESCAKPG